MDENMDETYLKSLEKVKKFLTEKGHNIDNLKPLYDDYGCNKKIIFRWSLIKNNIDYTIEYHTCDNAVEIFDCLTNTYGEN